MEGDLKFGGWRAVKLKDVCLEITVGHVGTMATQYVEEGIPFLRSQNIEPFRLNLNDIKYISPEFHAKLKKSALQPGDVVVVRTGYPGTACEVPKKLGLANCADLVIIRPSQHLNARFLVSIFNSTWGKGAVAGNLVGVAQQHFNIGAAKELVVRLPPLPTQRKIAAILSAYDDLIENNLRRIKILEEMAQNLYREWFVKFRFPGHEQAKFVDSPLGMIPEGWEVKAFSDEVDILSGGTPSTTVPEYWNGEIPWMTPKDIQCSIYVMDTERKITSTGLNKCSSALYPAETIFITARGTVGRCVLAAQPMAMSQTSYALIGRNHNPQHYVYLMTLELVESLKKAATGAVFDTIIVDTFKRQYVAFPPLDLRIQVANQASACFGFIKNLLRRNTNLRRTRDLLLPKLISGEVDVSAVDIAVPLEAEP